MADHLIALARAARGADRQALEELLQETVGFLHALARARLGDTELAQRVTGDALTRIARGIGRLRDPQAYPHWAYRILQRCIARHGGQMRPTMDPRTLTAADPQGGPVDVAVQAERRTRIANAVAGLPPKLREPVMLHFVCGLAYREIARVLGIGVGSVARRMTKALGRLRPVLGDA